MDPNDRMNAESKLQNGARNRGDGGWGRTFARFRCRHRSNRCHPMPVSMGHSGLAAKSDADVESKPARHMSLTRCLSRSGCAQRERTRRLKMKVDMPGKKRRKLAKWTSESVRPIVFVGAKNSNAGTVRPGPHQCQSLSGAHTRQQYEKKTPKLGQTLMWRLKRKRRFPRHYWQGAIMAAWVGQRSPSKTCIVGATVDVAFQGQAFFANRQSGKWILFQLPPARLSADRRLIAGVKLIRVPSGPRRHRNWHSPRPPVFPTSPFSTFNNITLITATILQRRFQLWILSSSDPQCTTYYHDVEVKEVVCNRLTGYVQGKQG